MEIRDSAASMESDAQRPTDVANAKKREVCENIITRLRDSCSEALDSVGFVDDLHAHFQRLPLRYALDVNLERAEDVLEHKRLLDLARTNKTGPPFLHIRSIHVLPTGLESSEASDSKNPKKKQEAIAKLSILAPPSFGSSVNLEALALGLNKSSGVDNDKDISSDDDYLSRHCPIHEVTFSTSDKQKLLGELSYALSEVGLNIREAHVFSTDDGFSLDVFVVDGWPTEDTQELQQQLEAMIASVQKEIEKKSLIGQPPDDVVTAFARNSNLEFLRIPSYGTDDWEIDPELLKYEHKVASGSFGDLFRGTYRGQDVAIKVLKSELNEDLQKEFAQEVSIMRKVRHKNVVQFIGACTRPPKLCIVTEFMSGGSVHDYLHKKHGTFKLPTLMKIAIDVSKGMDYLHQSNIIHRDLKAANLLIDEHEVIKVADFGVARVQSQIGVVMTAETGTYRWMAPEVIEHRPYNHKADVFSFGIVIWELLTGKLPYEHLTPLQAAVGVVEKGLRPTIRKDVNPRLAELLNKCWQKDPAERPEFSEITIILQNILKEAIEEEKDKEKKKGGLFSVLKKNAPLKKDTP